MKLKVSHAAALDLEGIWLYTVEHWSEEQADRYLSLLLDSFDEIRIDPNAGRDFTGVRASYRCMKVGTHLIFYRMESTEVEVIRILHERMDAENLLGM